MRTLEDLQSKLSACLPNSDVQLQVKQTGSQLSIVINRLIQSSPVDYDAIADILTAKVKALALPDINAAKFYGRAMNAKQVEWQRFEALKPESASSAIAQTPPVTPRPSEKTKPKLQTYLEQFSHYSNVISAAALLGLLLLLGFNTLAGQKTQSIAWEYKLESVKDIIFTESMNQLGKEGWELVSARRAKDSSTDDFSYECIFKRAKKN